jgi:hypothetical protein
MKYLTRLVALHNRESSVSLASAPYGETNDQNDLHVGCADRGDRIFNAGHGCWQRSRGTARHDQGSSERYGLCAGTKRRRLCLGSLYCTAVPAQYRHRFVPIATESRAGRPRQPDCLGNPRPSPLEFFWPHRGGARHFHAIGSCEPYARPGLVRSPPWRLRALGQICIPRTNP